MKLSTRLWSRRFLKAADNDLAGAMVATPTLVGATFGDSHMNGVSVSTADTLATALGITVDNYGVNGDDTNEGVARLGALSASGARMIVCHFGTNDIAGGVITLAEFLANYRTILDTCATMRAYCHVLAIYPYTAASNASMAIRDTWNTALAALVAQYPLAQFLDVRPVIGLFRAGGAAGNLWDLQAAYDEDGSHLSVAGQNALAAWLALQPMPWPLYHNATGGGGGGAVTAAAVLAAMQDFNPAQAVSAQEAMAIDGVRSALVGRHWDDIVVLTPGVDAISTALSAVTLNSVKKRTLLYLPNGAYSQTVSIECLSWVDIIGESMAGVVITSPNNIDLIKVYDDHCLLANFTVSTEVAGGATPKYPIHIDNAPVSAVHGTTMILWQVTAISRNGNKSGVGVGSYNKQRLWFVDCTFTAEATAVAGVAGFFCHNGVSQANPTYIALLNCVCTSAATNGSGLDWQNQGSGKRDMVQIVGGTFTGNGTGVGIKQTNTTGAGEARISISPTTVGTTSFADAATEMHMPPCVPMPHEPAATFTHYTGTLQMAGDTFRLDANGTFYSYGNVVPVRNTSTTGACYFQFTTANNHVRYGTEGNAGGAVFSGTAAYEGAIGTAFDYPFGIFQNGIRRCTYSATAITATVPRVHVVMTKAARNALTGVAGMEVFQSDGTPGPRYYTGAAWVDGAGVADP